MKNKRSVLGTLFLLAIGFTAGLYWKDLAACCKRAAEEIALKWDD